jgi:formate-dependent nitrite reductase cytochrome c552 subunit
MASDVQPRPTPTDRPHARRPWGLILTAAAIAVAGGVIALEVRKGMGRPVAAPPEAPAAEAKPFAETIRKPAGQPGVKTDLTDLHGRPVIVACATCHATREPNPAAKLGADLRSFHQGLTGQHGGLACVACHNPAEGYGSLRLADGRSLPYAEAMQLCAQCHGPQYRDYQHGAHGGMTGHWDLTRGPRVRNTCTDCHDPHAPKYPTVRPAPGPRDRDPHSGKESGHE